MSWPVSGGLMIEPTESEDKPELDRFCDAMIMIRHEIQDIIDEKVDKEQNMLKLSPFTLQHLMQEDWPYSFSRNQAGYPAPWQKYMGKVFPSVGRIDNVYGDRNIVCACPPVSEYFDFEPGQE